MYYRSGLWSMKVRLFVCLVAVSLVLFLPRVAPAQEAEGDTVVVSGTVEVEAGTYKRSYDDALESDKANDIVLATIEVGVDARINPSVTGHVLFLWEEGETEDINDFMDEGTITISNPDKCPYYLTAGKMYIPFGSFDSAFISDPMTLELGEINDSAIQIGHRQGNTDISFGFFNGDLNKVGKDDKVNAFFANVDVEYAQGPYSTVFGVSYISNIADTDALEWVVNDKIDPNDTTDVTDINDFVDGMGIFLKVNTETWFLSAEYVAAMDDFAIGYFNDSSGLGKNSAVRTFKPAAYNVEFGWQTMGKALLAVKYEQADDMEIDDDFDFPESRYGVCLSYSLYEDVDLKLEYLYEKYDNVDLHKGKSDIVTAQLAVSF